MTHHDALLAAVLANPADDTPRLVYADWCEENGQDARAEFIRLQCRIASIEKDCRCGACVRKRGGGQHHNGPCGVDKEREELPDGRSRQAFLRRRERELFGLKRDHVWCVPAPLEGVASCHNLIPSDSLADAISDPTRLPILLFTRGFVSHVTCTAEDWLAHADALYWRPGQTVPCRCAGSTTPADLLEPGEYHCDRCRDTGKLPRPCPPTAHPVERVTLTTWPTVPGFLLHPTASGHDYLTAERWPGVEFKLPLMAVFAGDGREYPVAPVPPG